ncbi:MAG TPA: hypothetical protein VN826_10125 [Candidatus Eisenbacteria bacterium]|nr:hypothetical protein [Candidatus Eisenbacteria bacterium]
MRWLADVMLSACGFGLWPAMTTSNTPEEHVKALRAAFTKAVKSSDLLAEAKQKNKEVDLIGGEDLAVLGKEVVRNASRPSA